MENDTIDILELCFALCAVRYNGPPANNRADLCRVAILFIVIEKHLLDQFSPTDFSDRRRASSVAKRLSLRSRNGERS